MQIGIREPTMNHISHPANAKTGHYRWVVCVLLFFAVMVNYIDRAVFAVLKPMLDEELGWDQKDYGWMVTAFQASYAIGYVVAGRFFDRVGVRWGFMVVVVLWSVAAVAHAAAHSVTDFIVARALLGLAQGGCFPGAIKAVTEWFPRQQRALATGWFNTGSNAGAIACPLLVPFLAGHWGWQGAFIVTGLLGFVWVAFWAWIYRSPETQPRLSAAELAFIRQDVERPQPKLPWRKLLGHRQTWAFMVGMMASSPIWWFYIFWAPDFLNKRFGLDLSGSSLPLMTIFLVSSFGGIAGGWLSSTLLRRGRSVNVARKTALLVCALCVLPVFATPLVSGVWMAVALITLAAAAHCGFAANLFTLVSDMVPRQAVASVTGLGGMAGSIAGMCFSQVVSRVLHFTDNNYLVPFGIAATAYLLALIVMHLLVPRLEPMRVASPSATQ